MAQRRPPPTFDEAAPLAERAAALGEEDSEALGELARASGRRADVLSLWGAAWRAGRESALRTCLSGGRGGIPEELRTEAVSAVDAFCRERVPAAEAGRVSWVWDLRGCAITIEERRRPAGGTVVEVREVAQVRYDAAAERWHLFARREGGAWWPRPAPEATLAGCLRAIASLPPPVGT